MRLLSQATTVLCKTMDRGWTTKDTSYDMVQWRDRKWNTVADRIANIAMDTGRGSEWWSEKWPGQNINIMLFVDGGRRGNGKTSSAFAAFALRGGYMILFGQGAVVQEDTDSFVAECRSMHLATSSLLRVLQRLGDRSGGGKSIDYHFI